MTTITASEARANLYRLIDEAAASHQPLLIINIQHRLIYQVLEEERVVKVLRLWSHYA